MQKSPKELWIRRGLLTGTLFAFVLPFLRVEDCQSHEVSTYIGLQLLPQSNGYWLLLPIFLAVLLIGLSFLRYPKEPLRLSFGAWWRAVIAAFSAMWVGLMSPLLFMFDHVTPHVGYFLCLGCWIGVIILCWVVGSRAFLAYRRANEGIPPLEQTSILQVVFRVTALAVIVVPFIVLALLGEELLHVLAAAGTVVLGSVPLAAALECCARAAAWEERWGIGWGVVTTAIVWLAIAVSFLA